MRFVLKNILLVGFFLFVLVTTWGIELKNITTPNLKNAYIKEHFYSRPPEITIDTKQYGLDGNTFYVSSLKGDDNNPGTLDKPFLTIQHAVDLCNAGDIIYVMEGTYTNIGVANVACFMDKHGTSDHWIMLRNYPGDNPFIIFNGWDAISIQGSSYIIVSGFIIQGNADEVTYEYAYKNRENLSNPVTMGNGIGVFLVWNDYSKRSHHVIAINNIVYNCPGCGFSSVMADYVSFMNNIICYNAKWSPCAGGGISMYQDQAIDDSKEIKMIISGNVIYGNENKIPFFAVKSITDGNGIIIDDSKHIQKLNPYSTPGRYLGKTLIENNICFDNGGQGISAYDSEFVTIQNNTCYYNAKSKEFIAAEINVGDSDSITVQGNIAVSTNNGSDKAFNTYGSSNIDLSYNLFKGIVDPPGPGKNSFIGRDPNFINASIDPVKANFHLDKKSPAVDSCPFGPKIDYDGISRPQGFRFDMGAYENQY